MADFCKLCSINLFGEDFRDMAGLLTQKQQAEGRAAAALCEGCGRCYVDVEGKCLTHNHAVGDAV